MSLVQANANNACRSKTVFYSGTDILRTGYALCYDPAASATDADPKKRLGRVVIKPATANLMLFAGVVSEGSDRKAGPCFVEIDTPAPGDPFLAYTKANATIGVTCVGPADGEYALAAYTDSGLNLPLVGVALATQDTSTTAALTPVLRK